MAAKQATLKGVVAPLDIAQEAAFLYIEAKEEATRASERAAERKLDMVRAAARLGIFEIKVHDRKDNLHIFDLNNEVKVRQTKVADIKIEKIESEERGDGRTE